LTCRGKLWKNFIAWANNQDEPVVAVCDPVKESHAYVDWSKYGRRAALAQWVVAVRGGKPTSGDFLLAGPMSDAFNLAAVTLRLGGKRLFFDSANMKITNVPEANDCLVREYRKGWELTGV
jgi:hypothetical protein